MAEEQEQRRDEIGQAEPEHSEQEQPRRVLQLVEGPAGDHAADLCERTVRADALRGGGEAKPQAAAGGLHASSQGAVVNHFSADRRYAPCALEYLRPDENASTGSAGHLTPRLRDPRLGVKLEEEEDE